ncbi:MAG TPA: 2-dehydropantoate 2-reductase [Spirochaetia bacterium]|nr:2-dehydropantoate 2-reductase [Spirochaetia bacterium]
MAHIAVVGAGAIGGSVGALLHRAGHRVTLTGRPEQVHAIRKDGLLIRGALGEFSAHLDVAERLTERPEFALIAVKTQDLASAISENRASLTDVPVVTMQNGVRADDIAAQYLSGSNIVSAVVLLAASYLTPGTISIQSRGSFVIGHPFKTDRPIVPTLRPVLDSAIPTRATANIRGAHWLKLILNLNNALPAVTNLPLPEIFAFEPLRRLGVLLIREGARVIRRAGIKLDPLPQTPVALIRLVTMLPAGLAGRVAAARIRKSALNPDAADPLLGSTLQSLRRGRPTEIDYLNGEIVRLGRDIGLPTPLNGFLVRIVHEIESTGEFWSAEKLAGVVDALTG